MGKGSCSKEFDSLTLQSSPGARNLEERPGGGENRKDGKFKLPRFHPLEPDWTDWICWVKSDVPSRKDTHPCILRYT